MKKANTLWGPLLWTAAILLILLAIISIRIVNPAASLIDSVTLISLTGWYSLKWLFALSLGVLFCLIFLFIVFFAAIALVNRKEAGRMFAQLLRTTASWLLRCDCQPVGSTEEEPASEPDPLRQEVQGDIQAIQTQLHETKELLSGKVEQLSERIDVLETLTATMADTNQVESLRQEVSGAIDSLAGIQSAVENMKTCVAQTAAQLEDVKPEKMLGDLPERLQTLEERPQPVIDITPLEKDIAVMQQELALVQEKADKALSSTPLRSRSTPAADKAEHRIFSYFDDPADKSKIAETVRAALKKNKNMSYKQVIDAVIKELDAQKGKIVSSHPSLIKDYIRSCRSTG